MELKELFCLNCLKWLSLYKESNPRKKVIKKIQLDYGVLTQLQKYTQDPNIVFFQQTHRNSVYFGN